MHHIYCLKEHSVESHIGNANYAEVLSHITYPYSQPVTVWHLIVPVLSVQYIYPCMLYLDTISRVTDIL